jgi:hypothetical protein
LIFSPSPSIDLSLFSILYVNTANNSRPGRDRQELEREIESEKERDRVRERDTEREREIRQRGRSPKKERIGGLMTQTSRLTVGRR